ncbi:MAG: hypothetical protein QOJ79_858 [Actinomycetota bacterium]|jgi:hypothetical protein|nr:hypothetical protein [Actinomycetota bacterium]
MSSVRARTLLTGAALAVAAFLLADQGALFGSDLPKVALLGAAAGAVLGLIRDHVPVARLGGFLAGFLAAWIGYALRAGFLPDIPLGRAIAAAVVVALVTAVAVVSADRMPMWAGFLGAVTLLGSYETTFAATPTSFVSDSMTAVTTSLLAVAFGFLVTVLLGQLGTGPVSGAESMSEAAKPAVADVVPAPRATADSNVAVTNEVAR